MTLVVILIVLVASYFFCGLREIEWILMIGDEIDWGRLKKEEAWEQRRRSMSRVLHASALECWNHNFK